MPLNSPHKSYASQLRVECAKGDEKYQERLKSAGHKVHPNPPECGPQPRLQSQRRLQKVREEIKCGLVNMVALLKNLNDERVHFEQQAQRLEIALAIMAKENDIAAGRAPQTLDSIARRTASKHGITLGALKSQQRTKDLVHARQEAFWLAHKLTDKSYPTIGRYFGRDHATVMHGVKKHADRMKAAAT